MPVDGDGESALNALVALQHSRSPPARSPPPNSQRQRSSDAPALELPLPAAGNPAACSGFGVNHLLSLLWFCGSPHLIADSLFASGGVRAAADAPHPEAAAQAEEPAREPYPIVRGGMGGALLFTRYL